MNKNRGKIHNILRIMLLCLLFVLVISCGEKAPVEQTKPEVPKETPEIPK